MSREYRKGFLHALVLIPIVVAGGFVWGFFRDSGATKKLLSEREAREVAESVGAELASKLTRAEQEAWLANVRASDMEQALGEQIAITARWRAKADRIPARVTVDRMVPVEVPVEVPGPSETVYVSGDCEMTNPTLGWDCRGESITVGGRAAFRLMGRSWADFELDGTPVNLEIGWEHGETLQAEIEDTTPPPPERLYSHRFLAGLGFGDGVTSGFVGAQAERKRWGVGLLGAIYHRNGKPDYYESSTDPVLMLMVSRKAE